MNGKDIVYRTIVIRGQSEGIDKVTADLNKLAGAHEGVTIASEETEKSTRRLEQAMQRSMLRFDAVARAQNEIEKQTKLANKAVREELISREQADAHLARVSQHYSTASTAAKGFAQQTGLARHELVNLGRQAQDVGVSLASGQSPLMVLVQQGTQIADVFATSGGTVRGFFSQAIGWAGRFAASTAGVVTGIGAIAAGALYMASSWATAQREIEKALAGLGAASGMTLDGINRIAERAGGVSGMSVGQAREAATAFAATGKIYEENIVSAIGVTRDLALAMGTDTADAAKTLAEALVDPAKGAQDLDKQLGFLDATTLDYIRTLQSQNNLHEAQKVMMDAIAASAKKQADMAGFWTRAWNDVTASANLYSETLKKVVLGLAQLAEQATGVNLGGFTDEQQLDRALQKVQELQRLVSSGSPGLALLNTAQLQAATEEVARLEQKLRDVAEVALDKYFNQVGKEANAFTQALIPSIVQAENLEKQIRKLQEAQALGVAGPHTEAAIQAAERQLMTALQTTAALEAQANVVLLLTAAYPGLSIEMAKQQAILDGQLGTIQQLAAAEADIEQYLVRIEQLRRQGLTIEEAELEVARERRSEEERIAGAKALQVDYAITAYEKEKGITSTWKESAGAAQDKSGAASAEADALKKQREELARQREELERQRNETDKVNDSTERLRNTWQDIPPLIGNAVERIEQLSASTRDFVALSLLPGTQFKKEGYTSSWDPLATGRQKQSLEDMYGAQNIEAVRSLDGSIKGYNVKMEYWQKKDDELGNSLDSLTKSTDSLNETMKGALSPFYSQDPRTTKLGFRAGTVGNPDWLTGAGNANPLDAILGRGATAPGMANGGSFVVGGGYSANDNKLAMFPVASGEEVIVNRSRQQGRGGQVVNIDNRIIIQGGVDADTLSKLKISRYQQAQRMRAGMARAS